MRTRKANVVAARVQYAIAAILGVFSVFPACCQSWTIANDRITRTVSFAAGKGLVTEQLSDLQTGLALIAPPGAGRRVAPDFSFLCNGINVSGAGRELELIRSETVAGQGSKTLSIRLKSVHLPLEVEVKYRVYEGQPAVRKWLLLKNTGTAPLKLTHLNIEAIYSTIGAANEILLNAEYGSTPRELLYTGRSEDAGLLVSNARTGNGFAILSEVPGYMKRTEIDGFYDPGRIHVGVMYDTDLMPFERTVAPGETFTSAAVSIVTFRNGDGFHDPHWVLPTYSSKVLQRRISAAGAPWIYNTWSPFRRTINRDTTLELVDIAGRMGMDIFTIDDGWLKEYGANDVDLKAFPDGLDPIRAAVEARGMRLGLWMSLAAIGTSSKEYTDHPEWQTLDLQQHRKITSTAGGEKVVMCMASPFRDAAAARINDAIERFHLAYVKLDLTTIFNAYGEAPGCWAKGHDHGSWAESLTRTYEGIAHVTQKIYEKHPDVLIDLTFELWGQKHVIDAGLLSAGDMDWISNVDDSRPDSVGPAQARALLYHRSASMPVESMLIGNMQADLPSPVPVFATAVGSAPLLLGDLRRLSPSDRAWYASHIRWYKGLRHRARIDESFFPLGSWHQPAITQWDGFARLAHSGDGLIAVFRNGATASSARVALPLMPEGRFRLHSVITGKDLGDFTKAQLAEGVDITFPSQAVELLEVSAVR